MSYKRLLVSKIIIALDGYSGTGKSSTAKQVARSLGYTYIDSGAMYRAVTLFFLRESVDLADAEMVEFKLRMCNISFQDQETVLNGQSVENEIRSMEVNDRVSEVSAVSAVRVRLVEMQRQLGSHKGVVMDGRDIGTVVFPQAELKVFMTADLQTRAERRLLEITQKGQHSTLEEVAKNLEDRDRQDANRKDSPLRKANGAVEIDTTHLTLKQQVDQIVSLAKNHIR